MRYHDIKLQKETDWIATACATKNVDFSATWAAFQLRRQIEQFPEATERFVTLVTRFVCWLEKQLEIGVRPTADLASVASVVLPRLPFLACFDFPEEKAAGLRQIVIALTKDSTLVET